MAFALEIVPGTDQHRHSTRFTGGETMIIRTSNGAELILVPQTEHSKLVGQLAGQWGNEDFVRPEPFASVVRAATFHDFGWVPYESNPLFDAETGETPHYLNVPNGPAQLRAYEECAEWLGAIDRYSGLLVDMHRTGLWQRRYGVIEHPKAYLQPAGRLPMQPSDEVQSFIAKREALQIRTRRELDEAQVWTNYRLLQVWDLLGLYFSCHEPDELYITPVPTAYTADKSEGVRLTMKPIGPNEVAFDPFPFRIRGCRIALSFKRLPSRKFRDAEAFASAYFQAPFESMSFALV